MFNCVSVWVQVIFNSDLPVPNPTRFVFTNAGLFKLFINSRHHLQAYRPPIGNCIPTCLTIQTLSGHKPLLKSIPPTSPSSAPLSLPTPHLPTLSLAEKKPLCWQEAPAFQLYLHHFDLHDRFEIFLKQVLHLELYPLVRIFQIHLLKKTSLCVSAYGCGI